MRISKKVLGMVLSLGALTAVAQPVKHEWKQASAAGYTYKYVSGDPSKARFYTLKNVLSVILSPTNKDPRIQAYVAVKAGSKTDPATNTGLAHYLEHMMFDCTAHTRHLFYQAQAFL